MKTAKQEALQKAYKELGIDYTTNKNYINEEDGYAAVLYAGDTVIGVDFLDIPDRKGKIELKHDSVDTSDGSAFIWRPKSLKGIETNNGWIKIESEEDLPTKEVDVHIIFENEYQTTGVWDNLLKEFFSGSRKLINVQYYQPIERPAPPIY